MASPFASLHNSLPMPDVGNDPLAQLQGLGMPGANLTPPMMPAASPMTPLGGPSPVQLGAAPMRPAPALPQIPTQTGMPWWANLIPLAAAIGARMGGSPQMGTGVMQGWQQGQQLQQEQLKQQQAVVQAQREEALRKYQLQLQADQMKRQAEERMAADRAAANDRRQKALMDAVAYMRETEFEGDEDYLRTASAWADMLQNSFGISPSRFRGLLALPSQKKWINQALDEISTRQPTVFNNLKNQVTIRGETRTLGDWLGRAGRAVWTNPDGSPMVLPDTVDGSAFDMLVKLKVRMYRETYGVQGDPPAEIYQQFVREALEESQGTKERANYQRFPVEMAGGGKKFFNYDPETGTISPILGADGQPFVEEAPIEEEDRLSEYRASRADEALNIVANLMKPGVINESNTGWGYAFYSRMPETQAAKLKAWIQPLLAKVAFQQLQEMRASTPGGGALGQVSNIELALLQNSLAALDNPSAFSPQEYLAELAKVRTIMQKVKKSIADWEAGGRRSSGGGNNPRDPLGILGGGGG